VLGFAYPFLISFSAAVQRFDSGSGNGSVVFQIGKALNGHISVEKRELPKMALFGNTHKLDERIGPANSAISFFKSQLTACRVAVDMWSHIGIRCGVVKDIRVLISKLVWETRGLALYKV
jgi:hypothetical protein